MALTIGAPSQVLITPSTVSLAVPATVGGVGPYSYQWYRDIVPNVVPSAATLIAGLVGTSVIDGANPPLANNSIYYYVCVATDSTPGTPLTVTSSVIGICTAKQDQTQYQDPSVAQFQSFYDRDFPFGTDINTQVRIQDILKAFQQANAQINGTLYLSQGSFTNGCLWLR